NVIIIASSSFSIFDLASSGIGRSLGPSRACLLAAEYVRPQTSKPPVMQLTTLVCVGEAGRPCSSGRMPLRCPLDFRYEISFLRLMHSSVVWPWSSWKSHHLL